MTTVNIRICGYTNPHHTKGIADLINAYIGDKMGGGEFVSKSRILGNPACHALLAKRIGIRQGL
jgi:hypothetical protein